MTDVPNECQVSKKGQVMRQGKERRVGGRMALLQFRGQVGFLKVVASSKLILQRRRVRIKPNRAEAEAKPCGEALSRGDLTKELTKFIRNGQVQVVLCQALRCF